MLAKSNNKIIPNITYTIYNNLLVNKINTHFVIMLETFKNLYNISIYQIFLKQIIIDIYTLFFELFDNKYFIIFSIA